MNYRLYFNIFFFILLAFFLILLQFSFIRLLYYPFYLLDLIIPTIIFLFLITKKEMVWIFALSCAVLLDLLDFNFFILNIISLVLVVFLSELWLRNWFTKHSLYSFLVLSALLVFIRNIVYYSFLTIFSDSKINFFQISFWLDLIWQILGVLILVIIFFYLALKINKNLKPAFLGRQPLS
jgi:hypothetical protein